MRAADWAEQEAQGRDRDVVLARARELHDDNPDMVPHALIALLDDEFDGSTVWPSYDSLTRREVANICAK